METAKDFINRKEEQFEKEKDKLILFKHITRKGKVYWKREAWALMQQHNLKNEKVFVFERLKFHKSDVNENLGSKKEGDIEYRIGYYIVGKINNRKDKWTWGQFCPVIPLEDFNRLIDLAKKKGVIKE